MGEIDVWGVYDVTRGEWLGDRDVLYAVADEEKARRTAAMQSSLKNRLHEARLLAASDRQRGETK